MSHWIYRILQVEAIAPYVLRLRFDDGAERVVDLQPVLAGELYRPLLDFSLFRQVTVDPETHTVVWPNSADFDPETLHDWPEHVEALVTLAHSWEALPVSS